MIRFATVTTLLSVFLVLPVSAQITLTRDDIVPQFGEIASISFTAVNPTGLEAIVNATGGNQTYDFTTFTFDDGDSSIVDIMMPSSEIPGADDPAFDNAGFVGFQDPNKAANSEVDTPLYMFYSADNDGYYLHGTVAVEDLDNDGSDDTSLSTNIPPLQLFAIPLTFGATWSSTSTVTTTALGIEVSVDLTLTAEVDGWGTLITPSGQADCLRIMITNTTTVAGITTSVRALEFVTKEGTAAVIAFDPITGDPISVNYSVAAQDDDGGGGTTAIETIDAAIPDAFELHPNYPNPFNPNTVIPFGLSEAGPVTLSVYDALGREVATLVNQTLPAGSYTTDFDATHLPSGVYFYKLQANGTLLSRAMILQR